MIKEKYVSPEIEIVRINRNLDIITISNDDDEGNV